LIALLPTVHGRLRAVVEAHMPPVVFAVRLGVGWGWDSRMRRHRRHVILGAAAGRERSAQLRKRVIGRVRLDHRFSGRVRRVGRVCRRMRRLPVFLHWRKPIRFMLPSVVDGRLRCGRVRMGMRVRMRVRMRMRVRRRMRMRRVRRMIPGTERARKGKR
jgi:hypothetical protein